MAALRALQQWCRQQCEGYPGVSVTNMTTSFRDGLAFCAILHRHRPDLIDFSALRKENIYENNKLAFRVAEEQLGIPALLDAEDMVALKVPDRLSILTYVSQYYNYFHGRAPIGGVAGLKRTLGNPEEEPTGKKAPVQPPPARPSPPGPAAPRPGPSAGAESPPPQAVRASRSVSSTCAACGGHVHLVQRHLAGGRLYHRHCFRCEQGSSTLSPGAYGTTAEPGTFVCTSGPPSAPTAGPQSPGLTPRQPRAAPTDSGAPWRAREAAGPREAGPRTGRPAWEPVVGSPTTASAPVARAEVPAQPRLPTGPVAPTPMGSKGGTHMTNSSPARGTAAMGAHRTVPPGVPDPHPALPRDRAPPCGAQPRMSPSLAPLGTADPPAWTLSASRTQQAREKFMFADAPSSRPARPGPEGSALGGLAPTDALLGGSSRQRALSCLKKALPGLGDAGAPAPGRPPLTPNPHPRAEGPRASPPPQPSPPAPPQALTTPSRTALPSPLGVGTPRSPVSLQLAREVPGVSSDTSGGGAGSRAKLEAPTMKDPSTGSQEGWEDGPAGWRARLRPVDMKGPTARALELKEPRVPGELSMVDAPRKVSGSPKGGVHVTLTPVQADRVPGLAGPGPSPSAAAAPFPSCRRKLAIPASLDISGDWLRPESSGQRAPSPSWKEKADPALVSGKPGRPSVLAGAPAPSGKAVTSPIRLHPDYMPQEDIERQIQDIGRQLDALELRGVELEKRLRAAEGDATEDTLMGDWFRLIHEKQLLLRLESELMYKSKAQRLEEQQLDIEGELRQLLAKPDALKSPGERRREQELLQRYVGTVNERNDIVDCLDEDRLREQEEDRELRGLLRKLALPTGLQSRGRDQKSTSKFSLARIWPLRTPE
ncbi:MICAL-like protein 2 [Tamandua tetradactyla]|uniref:MICAL-like protein 2 n=1 Tax=Tamandua tetradactyla TaxID=48850 RepID=UPI0040543C05